MTLLDENGNIDLRKASQKSKANTKATVETQEKDKQLDTTPDSAELDKFDHGSRRIAHKRYTDIQRYANVQKQRADKLTSDVQILQDRLSKLEQSANTPAAIDIEDALSNSDNFQSAIQSVVDNALRSTLRELSEIKSRLDPIHATWSATQQLTEVARQYPDFTSWHAEMTQIAESMPEGEERSLEELYLQARQNNPEKAAALDAGMESPSGSSSQEKATEQKDKDKPSESTNEVTPSSNSQEDAPVDTVTSTQDKPASPEQDMDSIMEQLLSTHDTGHSNDTRASLNGTESMDDRLDPIDAAMNKAWEQFST